MERLLEDCGPKNVLSAKDRVPYDCDPRIESISDERSFSVSCDDDTPWSACAARGGRGLDIEKPLPL
jgi:hypothetical protein